MDLQQGDSYELIKQIEDNSIDLIISDPPYERDSKPAGNSSTIGYLSRFDEGSLNDISNGYDPSILYQFQRVLKRFNAFIFCSNSQILDLLLFARDNKYDSTVLGWWKYNSVPFAKGVWRPDLEYVVHIKQSGATFQGSVDLKSRIIRLPIEVSKYGHPTEKPMPIISNYVRVGSNEGDVVLDPFMGSGTTGHVCKLLKRKFIGFEIREDYFQIAKRRIAGNLSDLPMFRKEEVWMSRNS